MAREIIPLRTILDHNADGTFKGGTLQYKIKEGNALPNKIYTIGLKNVGINIKEINEALAEIKAHAEKAEGVNQ